jgi:hypothetical protein
MVRFINLTLAGITSGVVFPAPFAPSTAVSEPSSTDRSTPPSARTAP